MSDRKQGFTLIELAMVVLAIAFLIGVFSIGREILHNARLLSITTDIDKFKNAVISFTDKYKYLPGDMPTATTFWGTDNACPNTPRNSVPKLETCNGNGDSFIGSSKGEALGGSANWYETYRFWQHLASAGFIDGNYAGVGSETAETGIELGISVPDSKMEGNGYTISYVLPGPSRGVFNAKYNHSFVFGKPVDTVSTLYGASLTPLEAYMLDKKVDDGLPGTGFLLSFTPAIEEAEECASTDIESSAIYNTDYEESACSLIFISGF